MIEEIVIVTALLEEDVVLLHDIVIMTIGVVAVLPLGIMILGDIEDLVLHRIVELIEELLTVIVIMNLLIGEEAGVVPEVPHIQEEVVAVVEVLLEGVEMAG